MSNLTENKLNTVITVADITTMNTAITTLASKLPSGSLTDEQRNTLKAMDVNNKIFVEDILTELSISATGIVPPFINPTFIQNDLTLFERLDRLEANVANVAQRIADLKRICGDEAYTAALTVYRIYDGANLAGIPNSKQAYEKLKSRFDTQNTGAGRKVEAAV